MRGRTSWVGAVVGTCLVALRAWAGTERPCLPLPDDYRVSLAVRDGSAASLVEALACLMGVTAVSRPGTADRPVTVLTSSSIPLALAVIEVDRAASRAGLRVTRERKALRITCVRAKSCGHSPSTGRPVRVVLPAQERLAVLTTDAEAPSRAVLEDPAAIRRIAPDYVRLSEEVRSLARLDPMAFVSEGAAWPNLLGFPEPGFFITWLRPGGFFERVGLRVGDLVSEVNGYRLGSIQKAFEAYGALQEARLLIVRLRRGAESRVIIVEFETLGGEREGQNLGNGKPGTGNGE